MITVKIKKLIGSGLTLLLFLYPCLLLAHTIHMYLSGEAAYTLQPRRMLDALLLHRQMGMLFLLLVILALCLIWCMFFNPYVGETKTGKREVIPGVATPLAAGENQYGSARWLEKREYLRVFFPVRMKVRDAQMQYLQQTGELDLSEDYHPEDDPPLEYQPFPAGGLVVGQPKNGRVLYMLIEDTHSLTLGATRSGKGRGIVLPSICATGLAGESMINADPKGELFFYTAPFLRRLGYEVIALDFVNPEKSDRYNYMQQINDCVDRDDITGAKTAVWELVETLVGDAKGEPIWHNGECSVIACCIMIVSYDNHSRPRYRNLTNVYHFISRMCAPQGEKGKLPLQEYLDALPDEHPAKSLAGISNVAHFRTRSSFYTSALATLRLFEDYGVADMTRESGFDIYATGEKKRAIFIILPDEKTAYYSLASLFVAQHYQTMVSVAREKGGRLPRRVECFLDEIGNFTYIPAFYKQLTVGGGRGIRFHLFLQDAKMLDEVYGQNISAIVRNNCETWLYLQAGDTETLEGVSKKLGNYTTRSPNASWTSTATGGSTTGSYSYIARPLLAPDEVAKITRPYQLVMSTWYPAILYSPDISKTIFNTMLGMGDKEHNRQLTLIRDRRRPARPMGAPDLWGIWKQYEQAADVTPPEQDLIYKSIDF